MSFPGARPYGLVLLAVSLSALLVAAGPAASAQDDNLPQLPAGELVRKTVARELEAAKATSQKYMFRSRKQLPRGSQTRLYVETNDSMVGMTIATNDQPLNAQQQKAEQDRLFWLAGNPEQLRKKKMREKEDEDRTLRILRALPNAFSYEYDGTEAGQASMGKSGNPLKRLKFTPNPSYSPPSRLEQVLEGMQGYLLIDPEVKRLARIDGTLFRDVSFGWGIIGHLDRGGHFSVQQADIGDGSWEVTALNLNITGKILFFRGISIISDEVFSDFQRVPDDLTFGKGMELLKTEQEKLAHRAGTSAEAKGER